MPNCMATPESKNTSSPNQLVCVLLYTEDICDVGVKRYFDPGILYMDEYTIFPVQMQEVKNNANKS